MAHLRAFMTRWHLTEPFHKLALLRQLRRDEWLTPGQLLELQISRLRSLLIHAYRNVPYYRRLFDEVGFRPSEFQSLEQLPQIPISSKEMIRQQSVDNITASTAKHPLIQSTTSGSSGVALSIYQTPREIGHRVAIITRGNLAAGLRWRDRKLIIGNPREVRTTLTQRLGILPQRSISALADMDVQLEALHSYRPDVLNGYPSCLEAVARKLKPGSLPEGKPHLILSGGELLLPEARRLLEDVFRCPVIDAYAAEEVGRITVQCRESGGHHINADVIIVEIVRDGAPVGPGEDGRIVVTSLTSFAMPFIRYALDDIGSVLPGSCPCGRAAARLGVLRGRSDDLIRLPGGVVKHPVVVAYPIVGTPGVARFQVIQEREDHFTILLEKESGFTEQTIADMQNRLRAQLGNYRYDIRAVDEIPKERSGKQKTIMSRVPAPKSS